MKEYIVVAITLCRCVFYNHEVKLQQVENPKNIIVLRFDKFPAKKLDTIRIGHIYAAGGFAYYRDSAFSYLYDK